VRLFLNIKKLRTRAYANQKKRNRVSRHCQWYQHYLNTNQPRTPSLASNTIHLPLLAHRDHTMLRRERLLQHLPTSDTRDNLRASFLASLQLPPFVRMPAGPNRDRAPHSLLGLRHGLPDSPDTAMGS
jgi:hypothetical protein